MRLYGLLLAAMGLGGMFAATQGRADSTDPEIAQIVRSIDSKNIERTIRKLVSFGTRNTLSSQDDPKRGIGAARDWIYGEFQKIKEDSGGRLQVELQSFEQGVGARIPRPTKLTNVVATLPGTLVGPDQRVYIVSGHYDSMCTSPTNAIDDAPGADDDASGVAAVLEMARVMSRFKFDAPIIFLAVPGEEQGLLGATYFAEQARLKGWRVEAMFTNDIIGSSRGGNGIHDDKHVRVFSEGVPTAETVSEGTARRSVGGENDSSSRQLARFIKEVGEKYVRGFKVSLVYRRDRYGRGGDHIPFLERGFPAVRFCEPNEDYNHQHQDIRTVDGVVYGDLPEFADFAYTAQVTRVNAASLAMLARAPAAPRNVSIRARGMAYDTDLQWSANTEPDLAGYEIVWRDTTASLWTSSRPVGRVTAYSAKGLSKDDYLFGVRSVDSRDHKSPVAYPKPQR